MVYQGNKASFVVAFDIRKLSHNAVWNSGATAHVLSKGWLLFSSHCMTNFMQLIKLLFHQFSYETVLETVQTGSPEELRWVVQCTKPTHTKHRQKQQFQWLFQIFGDTAFGNQIEERCDLSEFDCDMVTGVRGASLSISQTVDFFIFTHSSLQSLHRIMGKHSVSSSFVGGNAL